MATLLMLLDHSLGLPSLLIMARLATGMTTGPSSTVMGLKTVRHDVEASNVPTDVKEVLTPSAPVALVIAATTEVPSVAPLSTVHPRSIRTISSPVSGPLAASAATPLPSRRPTSPSDKIPPTEAADQPSPPQLGRLQVRST